LLVDEDVGDLLLIAERAKVHHDLFRFNIGTNNDECCNAALDGFGCFVGSLLDLSGVPCDFKGFKRLVLELFWSLGFNVAF